MKHSNAYHANTKFKQNSTLFVFNRVIENKRNRYLLYGVGPVGNNIVSGSLKIE